MNEVNMIAKQVKPKNHIQKLEYKLKRPLAFDNAYIFVFA